MSIIPELSGTAAEESGNYKASFSALRRNLWQWTQHGKVKTLQSGHTPPIKAWMGKGPFLKDEVEAGAVYNDTHDINRLF